MRNQFSISNKENRPTLQRRLSLKPHQLSNSKSTIRMSIPSRRDSISINSLLVNDHQNIPLRQYKQNRSSFTSSVSVQLPVTNQKQAILNNLVKKLSNEEQLKEIIQSKIKKNNDYQYSRYRHDSTIESQFKLKRCEEELDYYKDVVKNLMQKFSSSNIESFKSKSQTHSVSTQTDSLSHPPYQTSKEFMDNLDRTLKILAGRNTK